MHYFSNWTHPFPSTSNTYSSNHEHNMKSQSKWYTSLSLQSYSFLYYYKPRFKDSSGKESGRKPGFIAHIHNSKQKFSIQFTFSHDLSSFQNITYAFQMTIYLQCFHMDNKTKPRCNHNKQNITTTYSKIQFTYGSKNMIQ